MMQVTVIIPALNEESCIGVVVKELLQTQSPFANLAEILVVDNGSSDTTVVVARQHGARVVHEPLRGYGSACARGIVEAHPDSDVLLFLDGDGSSLGTEWPNITEPLVHDPELQLVVGGRTFIHDFLPAHQRFGNWLATWLMARCADSPFTDLGPFRAIRREALNDLNLQDRGFGWTFEMQIATLLKDYKCLQIPVTHRSRLGGKSKIGGTIRGSFLAGKAILTLAALEIGKSLFRSRQ